MPVNMSFKGPFVLCRGKDMKVQLFHLNPKIETVYLIMKSAKKQNTTPVLSYLKN